MQFSKGDRIEMVYMANDPDPVKPGERGTVTRVNETPIGGEVQLQVDWDCGRRLSVILPEDKVRKVEEDNMFAIPDYGCFVKIVGGTLMTAAMTRGGSPETEGGEIVWSECLVFEPRFCQLVNDRFGTIFEPNCEDGDA